MPPSAANEWTWMGGSNNIFGAGVYGTEGVASASNIPQAMYGGASWTDSSGNFWLFGGGSFGSVYNALWEFNPSTNEWTWVDGLDPYDYPAGSTPPSINGVYGMQGVASSTNIPSALGGAVTWIDRSGNLWLFGGAEYLNDLWEFSPSTKEWTWMGGCGETNPCDAGGDFGTEGVAGAANAPGARVNAVNWTDGSGNFWLFGGSGIGISSGSLAPGDLNDLWEYDPSTQEWTWAGGAETTGAAAVYGILGNASGGNLPGARDSAVSWTDSSGNFWLFGGEGFDSKGSFNLLNDLWEFNTATKEWAWIGGSNTVGAPGVYGSQGIASSGSIPGARDGAMSWASGGSLWLFGGQGYDSTAAYGFLNDLWEFNTATKEWTWVDGSDTAKAPGAYGMQGKPSAGNAPGARVYAPHWIDSGGKLWLLGGLGEGSTLGDGMLNDLWRYQP